MQSDLFVTHSDAETCHLGAAFGRTLQGGAVVAFFGDLGAGKTTFIQGLVEGSSSIDIREVSSPTFNLLNVYQGERTIYHFDLYRLPQPQEFFSAGFDEYFTAGGICCIEWAEKIEAHLPADTLTVTLSHIGEQSRKIIISKKCP